MCVGEVLGDGGSHGQCHAEWRNGFVRTTWLGKFLLGRSWHSRPVLRAHCSYLVPSAGSVRVHPQLRAGNLFATES